MWGAECVESIVPIRCVGLCLSQKGLTLILGLCDVLSPLDINADEAPTEALDWLNTYVDSTLCGTFTRLTLSNAAVFPLCCPDKLCETVLVCIFCT